MEKFVFSVTEKQLIESKLPKFFFAQNFIFNMPPQEQGDDVILSLIPEGSNYFMMILKLQSSTVCAFLDAKTRRFVFGYKLKGPFVLKRPIVIFGTKLTFKKRQMFCCQHVYTGEKKHNLKENLLQLKSYLSLISPLSSDDTIFFSCTIMEIHANMTNLIYLITNKLVLYKIKCIEFIDIENNKNTYVAYRYFKKTFQDSTPKQRNLLIKSDPKLPDTYYVYEGEKCLEMLYIPDYRTSLYMNQLFYQKRFTLETLEESDSDDETDISDKQKDGLSINCYYSETKKKWIPELPKDHQNYQKKK
jgi:hypothetical protein